MYITFRFIRQSRSLQMISLCNHPKLSLDDLQQIITSSNSSSLQSIIMTGCYFSNPLSTDFLDAVMTKTYSDRPLKQISFQLAGNLNEVDKMSLKQIWLDKWPEIGRYSFLGGTAKLWIDESWPFSVFMCVCIDTWLVSSSSLINLYQMAMMTSVNKYSNYFSVQNSIYNYCSKIYKYIW